jgi:hypothetical protein
MLAAWAVGRGLALIVWSLFGVDQPGTPTRTWTVSAGRSGSTYHAAFVYTRGGVTYSDECEMTPEEYAFIGSPPRRGASVTVRVVEVKSLRYARLRDTSTTLFDQIESDVLLATFFGGFGALAVWLFFFSVCRTKRVRLRLYRWGVPEPGVVKGTRRWSGRSITSYYLDYEFVDADGVSRSASHEVDGQAYSAAAAGQSVTVLHLKGRAKPSVVYEYGGYRVVGATPGVD